MMRTIEITFVICVAMLLITAVSGLNWSNAEKVEHRAQILDHGVACNFGESQPNCAGLAGACWSVTVRDSRGRAATLYSDDEMVILEANPFTVNSLDNVPIVVGERGFYSIHVGSCQ